MKAFKKTLSCILALSITASMMTETLSLGASANATAASVSNVTDGDLDLGDPDPQADLPQITGVSSIDNEAYTSITSLALSKALKTSIILDDRVVDPAAPKVYADASELNFSGLAVKVEFDETAEDYFGRPNTAYDAQDQAWQEYAETLGANGLEIKLIDGTEPGDLVYAGIAPYVYYPDTDDFCYCDVDTLVGKTSVTGTVTLVGQDYDPTDEDLVLHTAEEVSYDLPVVQIAEIKTNLTEDKTAFVGDEFDPFDITIQKRYADSQEFEPDIISVNDNDKVTVTGATTATAGDKIVTISYFGASITFHLIVSEDEVVGARLTGSLADGKFYVGDTVEALYKKIYDASMRISVTMKSAKPVDDIDIVTRSGNLESEYTYALADGVVISGFDTKAATGVNDEPAITFTYKGVDVIDADANLAEVPYTVSAVAIKEIKITSNPTKVSYVAGGAFDPTGLAVKAIYNNGEEETLTSDDYIFDFDGAAEYDQEKQKWFFCEDLVSNTYSVDVKVKIGEENGEPIYATDTFVVTIEERKIISAEFVSTPETANFCIYDDEPVLTDLLDGTKIKFKYNDDTYDDAFDAVVFNEQEKAVLNEQIKDAAISAWDSSAAGEATVTVTLKTDVTVEVPVYFYEYVKEIEVTALPDKTEYGVGSKFDPEGMKIAVTYENDKTGDPIDVANNENIKITGFKSTRQGTIKPKVTYTGDNGTSASAEFELTIKAAEVDTIVVKTNPTVDYVEGQAFDITGAKALVTYENGIKKTVPITVDDIVSIAGSDVESEDDLILGHELADTENVPVIVNVKKYKDEELTIYINVAKKTVTSARLTKKPTKLSYDAENDKAWDLTGGVIEIEGNAGKEQFKLDEIDWTDDEDVFDITSFADAKADADEKGKSTVTITAGEKKVTFDVTFKKVTAVAVSTAPTKAVYKLHEDAPTDLTAFEGGVAKLTFNDKTTATIPLDSELFALKDSIDTDIPGTQNAVLTYGTGNNKVNVDVPLKVSVPKSITLATKPDRTAKLYVGDDDSKILSYIEPVTIKVTYDDTKIAPEVLTLSDFLQGSENSVKIAKQAKGTERELDAVAKDDKKLVFTYTYRYLPADDGASLTPKALTVDLAIAPVAVAPTAITVTGDAKTEYFIGDDLETGKFKVVFTLNNGKTTDPVDVTYDSSSKKWVFEYDGIKGTVDISKYNNTKEGTYKITFAYKSIKATKDVTVAIDPQNVPVTVSGPGIQKTEFINLTDAFKEISKNGTADGEYTLTVDKVTEGMLTFPTKGLNLTLKGKKADSRIALTSQNLNSAFKGNLIIDADIVYYDKKTDEYTHTVALKAAGTSIFIKGDRTFASVSGGQKTVLNTPQGTLTTNKLSSLAGIVYGDVTITAGGSLTGVPYVGMSDLTFEAGSTGKIDNLDDCTLTLVKGSETDAKSGLPKVTIGNIKVADAELKATKEDSTVDLFIVDSEGNPITVASGEVVLTAGSAKNDISEAITIWNTTSTGEVLCTYQYGTAIRAEYSDAVSLKIGEDNAKNYPSFDKVFEAMNTAAKEAGNDAANIDYDITVNVDTKVSKFSFPTNLKKVTFKNVNDAKLVLTDVAGINSTGDLEIADGMTIESFNSTTNAYAKLSISARGDITLGTTVNFVCSGLTIGTNYDLTINNIVAVNGEGKTIGADIGGGTITANGSVIVNSTFKGNTVKLGADSKTYVMKNAQLSSILDLQTADGAEIILENGAKQIYAKKKFTPTGTLKISAGKNFVKDTTVEFNVAYGILKLTDTKSAIGANNQATKAQVASKFNSDVLAHLDVSGLVGGKTGYILEEATTGTFLLQESVVSVTGIDALGVDNVSYYSSMMKANNAIASYGKPGTDNIVMTFTKDTITTAVTLPVEGKYKSLTIKGKSGGTTTLNVTGNGFTVSKTYPLTLENLNIVYTDASGKPITDKTYTIDGNKNLTIKNCVYDNKIIIIKNLDS